MGSCHSDHQSLPVFESTSPTSQLAETATNILIKIPPEILDYILLKLDISNILKCRLVCKHLRDAVSDINFWHQVVKRQSWSLEQITYTDLWKLTADWNWQKYAILCIKDPFKKNLLKNGSGELSPSYETEEHGSNGRNALQGY